MEEVAPDKKVELEQMMAPDPKPEPVPEPEPVPMSKSTEDSDQMTTVETPTETMHPYRRTDEPKAESTVTDSADPNLLSGGGAKMGVTLMSKKEAAKTAGKVEAAGVVQNEVSSEKVLGWLKNGNTRFVKGTVRRDGQGAKDRKRVSQKPSPHAFILACSESIAPPELVFDQKLGEINVARNLGAGVDDSVIRAMEDSVQQGTKLVVVLNHSGCTSKADHHDAAKEIAAKSKMLDALIKSKELTIKTAIYDQDNGRVSF